MKKTIAAISALSLIALAAFQMPVDKVDTSLEKRLKEDLKQISITDVQKPDLRVIDFDLESE